MPSGVVSSWLSRSSASALGLEGADPLADHRGIDARFDGGHLALGAAVDFPDQGDKPIAALPVLALSLGRQCVTLRSRLLRANSVTI